DIPSLWDEKMHHWLGLSTTGNYRDGCMQDIHWTDGGFGYFPSYTLGAMYAAQLMAAARRALSVGGTTASASRTPPRPARDDSHLPSARPAAPPPLTP
ncbi:hypothetical protein LAN15_22465, partial [Mycobacterium tuberculosis]|nr:hypothetical protein [Mycobacterium tuberculosis]